jgi:RHS repeat-associated protein
VPDNARDEDDREATWRSEFAHDAAGRMLRQALPGAVEAQWSWGSGGLLDARRVRHAGDVVREQRYVWRRHDQLARVVETGGADVAYTHDVRGYLTRASFSDGRVQHRVADAVGNLFGRVEQRDRVYAPGGALLHDGRRQYDYDADGARVTRAGHDGTWRYAWSAAQELAAVERPDGVRVTFRYDALGRRVEKRVGERVETFAWDGDDMIAEHASDGGEVRWVYAPDAWTPLARSDGATMHAVLGDHVDSASEMYDAAGAVAWRAQLDLYGVATEDVAGVRCPWRNAGQYADDETGLYYNRFRYYDPQTGGYISKDPIGLLGGAALYGYVHDPLVWVDPWGLAPWQFRPEVDVDMRGGGGTYRQALDEAFRRKGVPREQFQPTMWAPGPHGKQIPVQWDAPGGAIVNVDHPGLVRSSEGPQVPHVGYQSPGKRGSGGRARGHILLDDVPATRPSLGVKKCGGTT